MGHPEIDLAIQVKVQVSTQSPAGLFVEAPQNKRGAPLKMRKLFWSQKMARDGMAWVWQKLLTHDDGFFNCKLAVQE